MLKQLMRDRVTISTIVLGIFALRFVTVAEQEAPKRAALAKKHRRSRRKRNGWRTRNGPSPGRQMAAGVQREPGSRLVLPHRISRRRVLGSEKLRLRHKQSEWL